MYLLPAFLYLYLEWGFLIVQYLCLKYLPQINQILVRECNRSLVCVIIQTFHGRRLRFNCSICSRSNSWQNWPPTIQKNTSINRGRIKSSMFNVWRSPSGLFEGIRLLIRETNWQMRCEDITLESKTWLFKCCKNWSHRSFHKLPILLLCWFYRSVFVFNLV